MRSLEETLQKERALFHYNLGLIYGNLKSDGEKAILHYRKYLELKPNADDREEVLGSIEKLK